jgi:hypothetical protein
LLKRTNTADYVAHKFEIKLSVRWLDTARVICYQPPVRSELLQNISRVVVKLGTGVLTDASKRLDLAQMEQLVAQVAALRAAGKEVVLVSSGAGSGLNRARLTSRKNKPAPLSASHA